MKTGVLGSGDAAKVMAAGFLKHRHDAMLGTRRSTILLRVRTCPHVHEVLQRFHL